MKKICGLLLMLSFHLSFAQENIKGQIIEINEGELIGVENVSLQWLNTEVGAVTDQDGTFEISYNSNRIKLIISKLGFKTDTVEVKKNRYVRHALKRKTGQLEEVTLNVDKKTTSIPFYSIANTSIVSSEELLKAACCNLSESFETNPSIDVNISDALIGVKHINMLGLNSPYILISQENIPMVRGASQTFGLTFTPGTWIESIQISKGAGSVVNGYESIVGQINTELIKPYSDDNVFVNAYGSHDGRAELNTHLNHDLNDKWSTGLYVHGRSHFGKFDNNNDNFLDAHLAKQINLMNRWQYQDKEKGWIGFFNFRYLNDDIVIGEIDFDPDIDKGTTNSWGGEILSERFDTSLKIGYVFPDLPYQSFGFQTSYSSHNQNSYFALINYDIRQESWYSNFIFNSIISDTKHKFKTGVSFTHDVYAEQLNLDNYDRIDTSLGAFFEYTYDNLENLNIVAGVRADNHNKLGFFVTPRIFLRYDTPWEKGVVRASAGSGRKIANIFSEHQHAFVTNRTRIIEDNGGKVYGLKPEQAWNYGLSFQQGFYVFGANGDVVVDYYSTRFKDQVVVDWEESTLLKYYNLEGESWANSFQLELNYNPIKAMHFKLSYKFTDVQVDYESGRKQMPFMAKNRFFANVSYSTNKESMKFWKFNATYNWLDRQRFPEMSQNPPEYSVSEYSPKTNYVNFQVTRVFSHIFEVYLGGENITNTKQVDPIISSDNPFGTYFDGAQLYAPTTGNRYYIGLRYKLDNREL